MAGVPRDKDKSAKWLIQHHGDAILRLGGVTDLVRWQASQAELVLPTGQLRRVVARLPPGTIGPSRILVEIATYPENSVPPSSAVLADCLCILDPRRGSQCSRRCAPDLGAK